MEIGKISESVLKRSVLKQIKSKNENVKNGAGVGSDCAIFACQNGLGAQSTATGVVEEAGDISYVILRAANSLAAGGGIPEILSLSLFLPANTEESLLKEIMAKADGTAKALGMQIAGGHTQVFKEAEKALVSVTVTGTVTEQAPKPGGAKPGQDVVVSKWAGLYGTAILAHKHKEELLTRYPLSLIDEAEAFDRYLSVLPEAATAVKSNVSAMHDVSGGGIFAALWELAESAGVGLAIDLKKIPVRQESIEVCEFFGINLYELLSGGCLLMTVDDGDRLVEALEAEGIPATVIGRTTDNNDKVVINEEERRFLERPRSDEITKI